MRYAWLLVAGGLFAAEVKLDKAMTPPVWALLERSSDYRLYWGIYVQPVGRITSWYMHLIDPFRRLLIYPAVLRHIRAAWSRGEAAAWEAT